MRKSKRGIWLIAWVLGLGMGLTALPLGASVGDSVDPPGPVGASPDKAGTGQTPQQQGAQPPVAPEVATPTTAKVDGGGKPVGETPSAKDQGPVVAEKPEPGVQSASGTKAEQGGDPEGAAEPGKESAPEKKPQSVTGAFGIPLGERFEPCLVAKVLAEEEKTYRAADKTEQKGTLYRVEPRLPNKLFTTYTVETTRDGVIYSIRGEFQAEDKASTCAVTKILADNLKEKYGKPRGKGGFGEWYAFRDMSVEHYRGIRLYANRCRRGIYSIQYSDDNARTADAPPPPEPSETSGL